MAATAASELRIKLRKETLRLRPLQRLCSDRSIEISPHYDRLKGTVEARLDQWLTDPDVRRKARDLDLAYFKATFVYTFPSQKS